MLNKKDKFLAAAQKLLERGSLDKALAEFLKAAQEDPKDPRTWLKVAEMHVRRGGKPEAIDVYLKTAELYSEQGFFQRAVAVYKNILKLSPGYVPAHFKLAGLFKQLGLLSDAMHQYELVAQVYQKSGKANEALEAMRQIVELNPDHAASRMKLAETAAQVGAVDEAIREFRRAADQLRKAGKMEDFLRVGERMMTLAPNDPGASRLAKDLATLYLERNNARFALAKLQPLFNAEPKDAETLTLLVRSFEQLGQGPKTVSVLRELAKVHAEAGRVTDQRETYKRILALDPNDTQSRDLLIRMESRPTTTGALGTIRPIGPGYAPPPPSTAAITFSEMAIPEFLLPKDSTGSFELPDLAGADTTQERVAFAAASLDAERVRVQRAEEEHGSELARILSEVDVFVKYGLLDRAAEHICRVFDLAPDHTASRERRAQILLELGRNAEAARELQILAEQVQSTKPAAAADYRRRALEADPEPAPESGAIPALPPRGAVPQAAADDQGQESGEILDVEDLLEDEPMEEEATSPTMAALAPEDVPTPGPLRLAELAELTGAMPQARDGRDPSGSIELDLDPDEGTGPIPLDLPSPDAMPLLHNPSAAAALDATQDALPSFGLAPSSGSFERVERTTSETPWASGPSAQPMWEAPRQDTGTQTIASDLDQVDFFIQQSLVEEALVLLDDMAARFPGHQGIADRRAQILALAEGALPQEQTASRAASAEFAPRAVVSGGGATDAATHGDLGIAYKEMGLHDAAIREFRLLAQDPAREVFALTMMGECFEAKGALADAVMQYKKALNRPVIADAEATQLYFQLGHVFEALGDRKEALYFFEKVAKRESTFRDVIRRVAALKGNAPAKPVETVAQGDDFDAAFDALLGGKNRG